MILQVSLINRPFSLQILYDVINQLESLLPLAKAGSEGCFTIIKSVYVDASSLALKNISVRLAKVSGCWLQVTRLVFKF